ncbi:hypothetical protein COCNU_11G009820 [Cocos nucifera]|uniref:Uncharacterized protein n=1 Tax=Cocos nucifera TaxID=13894 RepID=A0A8K0IQA8_COCNU|nr:hypothetical protein COCNU_11G009820 [Cocos nucifera]
MEYLMSVMAHSSVTYVAKARPKCSGKNLEDEMKELGKLRTAIMMEKCQTRDEVIICPIPRKRNTGTIFLSSRDHNELKVVADPDIIMSKASPPCFSCSPPIRASNPLIRDAHFREPRVQKGLPSANY